MTFPRTLTEATEDQISDWVDRLYKPDRLNREPDTRTAIIADRVNEASQTGWTLISQHDSITGRVEIFDLRRRNPIQTV